jgi:hypothetical protein
MKVFLAVSLLLCSLSAAVADSSSTSQKEESTVILVIGAHGDAEYGLKFEEWAALWQKASQAAGVSQITIGLKAEPSVTDRERLQETLLGESSKSGGELWIVLIGHGTFDGKEAKFNLLGPDVSASELASWLKPMHRAIALIDAASASGPFINKLSLPGRVIVTATRSGHEQNYARFGQYISETIADPQADLDKDGQTSLLEAFLIASHRVSEFYETEGRLATEHALLDDNGDGLGTPADWFRGVRAVKKAEQGASADGLRAHQFHLIRSAQELKIPPDVRAKRDELELGVAQLRESKAKLPEEEYYRKLESLLLDLAQLYHQVDLLK